MYADAILISMTCTDLVNLAHSAAYEVAKILHRDISGGNILIDKDGNGMLIDWDMCVWLENKEEVEKIGQTIVRDYVTSVYA